jgi:hypothetical protein
MEITPEAVGQFDTVLFLGVLYHLRHPFLGLEKMSAVTREVLVVETLMDFTCPNHGASTHGKNSATHQHPRRRRHAQRLEPTCQYVLIMSHLQYRRMRALPYIGTDRAGLSGICAAVPSSNWVG